MQPLKKIVVFIIASCVFINLKAQELYPNSEPASINPKNTLGIRLMNEAYNKDKITKTWHGAMFMYGINSKLMVSAMFTTSNHHYKKLPSNFIHTDTNQVEVVQTNQAAKKYDYGFESINLGFRYRFLNLDGDHKHFRMSLYSNGVYAFQPHDEAETTLMGDNKAIGGGVISTLLIKKLAVSFTGGIIKPFAYKENASNVSINYGNAYNYSLSFGYLVYPFKYKNFNQTNINLYAEFLGKSYNGISITKNEKDIVTHHNNAFIAGNYVEFRPAIQFIIKSNLRLDFSTALPLVNRSYIRSYPMYLVNIQYYLFL
jgi:hypothetical protein